MNTRSRSTSPRHISSAVSGACYGLALLGTLAALPISAQASGTGGATVQSKSSNKVKSAGIEPWAGRRVLFLMPLQLGAGWNADVNFGRAVLPRCEELLQRALQDTGKFSVLRAHRFNPLIQRGLQEKRLTEDQVKGAIVGDNGEVPTLEGIGTLLGQFIFDTPAMVADFRLEEVRSGGTATDPSVQVQVSGRLYQLTGAAPNASLQEFSIKSPITLTSDPARNGRNNIDRFLAAASNGFAQVSDAFVAPIQDIQFAGPTASGGTTSPTGVGGATPDLGAGGGAVESVPPVPTSPGGSASGGTGNGSAAPTGSVALPGNAPGTATRGTRPPTGTAANDTAPDTDTPNPSESVGTAPEAPAPIN